MTLVLGIVCGLLVAVFGIGGVVLTPSLILLEGADPREAALISLWCLLPFGALSAVRRTGHQPGFNRVVARMVPGMLAAGVAGALLIPVVPASVPLATMGLLSFTTGLRMLVRPGSTGIQRDVQSLGHLPAAMLGSAIGLGSTLTGSSGPAILLPILSRLNIRTSQAIAVSQAAQAVAIPIAILAMGHTIDVHWRHVLPLAGAVALGNVMGEVAVKGLAGLRRPRWVGPPLLCAGALVFAQLLTG